MALKPILKCCLLALLLGVCFSFLSSGNVWSAGPTRDGAVHLQRVDEQTIVFVLETPPYLLREVTLQGMTYQRLSIAGWGHTAEPGRPQMPVRSVLVAIPPEAAVSLEVEAQEVEGFHLAYQVAPVPRTVVDTLFENPPRYQGLDFAPDEMFYAQGDDYPAAWATIDPPVWIRQQRVVVVRLMPFHYQPATDTLRVAHRLNVALRFDHSDGELRSAKPSAMADPFAPPLQPDLLNGDMATHWQEPFRVHNLDASTTADWRPAGHKVLVDHDGLYRLTYTDTLAAGVDVAADPRTFKLYQSGREVSLQVAGEADGSFNADDEIIFYGQQARTRYTNHNIYWLVTGGESGRRMAMRDGSPTASTPLATSYTATLSIEENHSYSSVTPRDEVHDHWFWDSVLAYGSAAAKSYPFTLAQMSSEPFTATLHGWLAGVTSLPAHPDHHTQVYLNGHLVDDATWDGQTQYIFSGTVPSSALVIGGNVISVALPHDLGLPYDYVYVDRFELRYRRPYTVTTGELHFGAPGSGRWRYHLPGFASSDLTLLDITDPLQPVRILSATVETGTSYTLTFEDDGALASQYLVASANRLRTPADIISDTPSNLRSTANSADYVIITHEDFYTSVLPLLDYRASQGMRVQIVHLQDVYDEFSYGLPDAQAIHDFLAYAYESWTPPAPAYVLLVGDGTLDPKDYMQTGIRSYIPPYLAAADPWINETAADNRYVDVHGDDNFPDMYLGRLPVNSATEATAMVNKILAYEQHPPAGLWNRQILFVADNGGDFAAFSNEVAAMLPPGYLPNRVFHGVTHTTTAQTRAAIVSAINDGRLLVHYAGHSSYDAWANESFFGVADLPSLTNADTWPVMLPMTCYDGFYHFPTLPSLGESIVRADGTGAVASWSPTGLGVQTGHEWLAKGFVNALFNQGVTRLGPATMQGLLNLLSGTPNFHELIDTYVLFGDPALRLSLPYCNALGASDSNCDCNVDAADVQAVAARWHSRADDENYLLLRDVDANGTIDIADVMSVASDWGQSCGP